MNHLKPKQDYFRIPKTPPNKLPSWLCDTGAGIFAKCPQCKTITTLRVCYGCKEVMCESCLSEHQIKCLRKEDA